MLHVEVQDKVQRMATLKAVALPHTLFQIESMTERQEADLLDIMMTLEATTNSGQTSNQKLTLNGS